MNRPPVSFLAVVVVAATGLALAVSTEPPPVMSTVPASGRAAVVGGFAVCPELLQQGGDVQTRLTAGTAVAGEVEVFAASVVPGSGEGPRVLATGGRVGTFGSPANTAVAVAATAAGPVSGALEAEQVSRGVDGLQRGLAGTRCESTSPDMWFVGGSTKIGVESELVLVNPYDDSALVDVHLLGTRGPVESALGEGIVVGPRARKVIRLLQLAPEEQAIAVHVTVRAGRIAPAMRDARTQVDQPNGVDWVPRAGQPLPVADLAGIPEGNGRRFLHLAVPGEDDVVVSIQVTTKDEQRVPAGMEDITLVAGRVAIVDLTEELAGQPAALRIESADPAQRFLASVLVENHGRFGYSNIREIAYAGVTSALSGPALVTENRVNRDTDTIFQLHALDQPARVSLGLVPVVGQRGDPPAPLVVDIPAGRLVTVPLSRIQTGTNAELRPVVVTPLDGSGPVYAARVIAEVGLRGPLFTVLSLVTQPASGVPVPAVVNDPRVSLVDPRRPRD